MFKKIFLSLILSVCSGVVFGQKMTEGELRLLFDSLSVSHKGYNNKLQINITSLSLGDLFSSVALENNLNVSIDPNLREVISYNFFDAKVKDMFVFIYLNCEVEYELIGTILSVKKRKKIEKPVEVFNKEILVNYNPNNKFLSMDLKLDTLAKVLEKITRLTDRNFVLEPSIRNKQVNAYLQNRPMDEVLNMFAKSNNLSINEDPSGFYIIAPIQDVLIESNVRTNAIQKNANNSELKIKKNDDGTLNVKSQGQNISDIVSTAANLLDVNYIQYVKLEGLANLDVANISFNELLNRLFTATNYSVIKDGELYVIGDAKFEGLRRSELIRLENRTIESVKSAIPKELLNGLEISDFVELNALIVTGGDRQIKEVKSFVSSIDVIVPMVQIDIMLLYSGKKHEVNTGLNMGIGKEPVTTQGTLFPGVDITVGANTINTLLGTLNGFGVVNLGQVSQNFFMSLSFLENNNFIEIESTPKISTLNGHQAKLSIGETTYYQEQQLSFQPVNQNAGFQQSSKVWKHLEANLSVSIKPFVSADEYVTLTILVKQEDFGGRIDPTAPPNLTNQSFESVIRVKNGEMILLGGLEKKNINDSGKGTPILSRIPVLKWFFSSRKKLKEKTKLHILVRPIVTY